MTKAVYVYEHIANAFILFVIHENCILAFISYILWSIPVLGNRQIVKKIYRYIYIPQID